MAARSFGAKGHASLATLGTGADGGRMTRRHLLGAGLLLALAAVLFVANLPRVARERAKDPGLGVRALHAQGITGAGVQVAIVDGQLRVDHTEFEDRIVAYEELDDFTGRPFDAHGPAMASLLVGRTVGVAPGADLHYFALDFTRLTPERMAAAIDHVVDRNRGLEPSERVRLLSMSTGFRGSERVPVDAAIARAAAAELFVLVTVFPLDVVEPALAIRALGCSPWRDCDDPRSFEASNGEVEAWRAQGESPAQVFARRIAADAAAGAVTLYAPGHHRTLAGHRNAEDYVLDVEGGDSEWAPYLTGVLALALQVAPGLHAADLAPLLAGAVQEGGENMPMIDPSRVIERARTFENGTPTP